jgi:hypothetical protein
LPSAWETSVRRLTAGEDLGVEPIDLVTHMVDVEFFGVQ